MANGKTTTCGALLGAALTVGIACGPSGPAPRDPGDSAAGLGNEHAQADQTGSGAGVRLVPPGERDAPEISRSTGEAGGVVVFWPRVVPRSDEPVVRELARRVQRRLGEVVAKAAPKRPLDVRPEPERVCPRDGCEAMTVGVVLTVREGGCAVVALVAEPGQSPSRLVPWGGTVDLKAEQSAFREPPESQIVIKDMVPCDELFAQLTSNEESVLKAIAGVAPPGQP